MNELKEAYGLSDLEMADIYNSHFNTRLPAPLKGTYINRLKEALECKYRVVKH